MQQLGKLFKNFFNLIVYVLLIVPIANSSSFAANETNASVEATNSSTSLTTSIKNEPKSTSASTDTSPTGLESVQIGPLELIPAKVFIRTEICNGPIKCIMPTIRFKVKNTSSSDVKFILYRKSFTITDNFGSPFFRENINIKGGGLNLSDADPGHYETAYANEKNKLTLIASKQTFEAQLIADGSGYELRDSRFDFFQKHRPKSMTLSGVIGFSTLDDAPQFQSFSFSDVPVQVND